MLHTQIYLITIALEIGGCKSEAHRIHILVDMKQRDCIGPLSWSVNCNFVRDGNYSEKLVVGLHPPPSPAWANISIMMECTSESGGCHSVCTL
jgi:hypothetical protein